MAGQSHHNSAYPPPTIPRNEGEVTRKFSLALAVLNETADRAVDESTKVSRHIASDSLRAQQKRRKGP